MSRPLAYHNQTLIPAHELTIAVNDLGFLMGVSVSERLRTFQGRLFRLAEHLDRLDRSLQIVGLELPQSRSELEQQAERLVAHNHALLDDGEDLGLVLFVTPGAGNSPTLGMHTTQLAWSHFHALYEHGQKLVVSQVRQIPAECWPSELKCRSRMHYYLADQEASRREAGARALLLDLDGSVSEASTANVVLFDGTQLVCPPAKKILPGISLEALIQFAERAGVSTRREDLSVQQVAEAPEVLLTSTSPCVWPVVTLDGKPIGDGKPGPLFQRLLSLWGDEVGVDLRQQAARLSSR